MEKNKKLKRDKNTQDNKEFNYLPFPLYCEIKINPRFSAVLPFLQ